MDLFVAKFDKVLNYIVCLFIFGQSYILSYKDIDVLQLAHVYV